MRPLRLALVLHGWPPSAMGGTGLYVEALAGGLVALGHELALLAPLPAPVGAPARWRSLGRAAPGVEAFGFEVPPAARFEETWRRPDLDALFRDWLHGWGPDLVHVHHLARLSLGWLRQVRATPAGLVLTLHDYAIPCARGQLVDRDLRPCPGPSPQGCARCLAEHLRWSPLAAQLAGRLRTRPGLGGPARRLAAGLPSPGDPARLADRQATVAAALSLPHRLLSPSRDLARRMEALGLRRPELCALPLLRPVPPAPPPGRGPLRLLFLGSLIPTKGADLLVEAFARLAPGSAELSLVGPAPDFDGAPGWAAALQARVRSLPGARCLGQRPAPEIAALLAEHDVLVLPSRWPENSPLVLREATAAGLRTVVSREGGAGELDPEARTVIPGDVDDLLRALQEEVLRGRGRRLPLRWALPLEHAAALVGDAYGPIVGRRSACA